MSEMLDEMVQTFGVAVLAALADPELKGDMPEASKAGLRAVLEAHVQPMLAEAWNAGRDRGEGLEVMTRTMSTAANDYATRIIADLTREPKP